VLEYFYEGEERGQPDFVVFAGDALFQFREAARVSVPRRAQFSPTLFHYFTGHGNLDSQELVALAVLARPGLEKARQPLDLRRVGLREYLIQKDIHLTETFLQM
jgi:hypothetical protein